MEMYFISITAFSIIMIGLVSILAFIESKVVSKEDCQILINGDESKSPTVSSGTNLLTALSGEKIFIPSACGGGGSCAMCKVTIKEGGGDFLPTELPHLSRNERAQGVRLSCQVKVKEPMKIEIPDEIFSIQKFDCEVVSNNSVATFIKELKLKLLGAEDLNFEAGGYIQIDIPEYQDLSYKSFDIEPEYREDWEKFKLFDYVANNDEETFRAYSMANYPEEKGTVMLNVRIATPPPGQDVPPGIGSSYIYNLKPGDKCIVSGPYGEFFAKETKREMCFVGGGAGMAPMRSHIFDQLKRLQTKDRQITFWYGARSKKEMFYDDEFLDLKKNYNNFKYHVALSDPLPEDKWESYQGFIHQVLHDEYLAKHEDPTEIEYYLCGPPMMLDAMQKMLYDIGVEEEMIAYDDFG